jgi:hypothetical protein
LSDRSRSFVEGLGFNPDETNSLEKIKAKISGDQAASSKSDSKSGSGSSLGSPERNVVRKVPGFGTTTPSRTPVPNFTASRQPSSDELDGKYGSEIMEQVNAAMQRYDKNGDGKIDSGEMGEGRWGQPEPKESDLDKDGNATIAELGVHPARAVLPRVDRAAIGVSRVTVAATPAVALPETAHPLRTPLLRAKAVRTAVAARKMAPLDPAKRDAKPNRLKSLVPAAAAIAIGNMPTV